MGRQPYALTRPALLLLSPIRMAIQFSRRLLPSSTNFRWGCRPSTDTPEHSCRQTRKAAIVDERVPYIGYAGESELYTAEGVSAYNALQVHVEKKLSHGLQAGFSYTFSRSFDEQSALGLFYNGSNPTNLRGGYAPSDFDRTHVFNIDYHYEFPKFVSPGTWEGKVVDGWAIQGLITMQSGQPYSMIDYSGAVGSIFYSINDGITNPIVPLASNCTPQSALTGATGNNPDAPALKASCFTLPILNPGDLGGAIPQGDTFETNFIPGGGQRNIFRQAWQKRADISTRQGDQTDGAICPEVQPRRFQPDEPPKL